MSFVQIFVEDELTEAYEILAVRSLGIEAARREERRRYVRAARLDVDDFTTKESLLDSVERARRAGSQCVIFILDEEDAHVSPERLPKQNAFRQAFAALCQHLENLGSSDRLKQVKVIRIVSKSCLECWLLAHPQAIVRAFRGTGHYNAPTRNTVHLTPQQARDQIAHIIREVGRRRRNRRLMTARGNNIKSEGAKIAAHVVPTEAQQRNFSLGYFFDMITCDKSGCDHPFPESA